MQIDFDERLAASTVIVDGREWCQGTLTNLALNPSFEAAGSTVEVRRNFMRNAASTSLLDIGVAGGSGLASVAISDHPLGASSAIQWGATAAGNRAWQEIAGADFPSTVGTVYPCAVWVKAPSGAEYRVGAIDAGGTSNFGPVMQTVGTGSWQKVTGPTHAALTAGAGVRLEVRHLGGTGGTYQAALWTVGAEDPFSHLTSPDPDLTPSAVGAPGASPSVLTATRAARALPSGTGTRAYQSTDWSASGAKSVRIDGTQASGKPECIIADHTPSYMTQLQAGKTYTAAAWIRLAGAGTQIQDTQRKVNFYWSNDNAASFTEVKSEEAANGPGESLIRFTFTVPADATHAILRLGGNGIGHQAWWDDLTIVEGAHPDLMPFHGSTVNPEWPGVTYAWTGTPNASTSTRTTPTIDRIEVDRDPGTGWVPVRGGRRDVINGFVALTDHEMPLHQEVHYRVAGYSGDTYVGAFTGTVNTTIPGWCGVFVKIPANPNATVMVDPTNSIDIDSSTQGGSYDIAAGSSIAVAAWSGVNASRFTLNALTKTDGDSAQMRALLQKNRVILLQGPDWAPFPPGWYYVESVSEGLRGDGAIKQGRKWSLSLVSTGVPSGDTAGVAGASWNQIRAKYATWDELKTANDTWFDVLQGGN